MDPLARLDPMNPFGSVARRERRRRQLTLTVVVLMAGVVVVLLASASSRENTPAAMLRRSLPVMRRLYGGGARVLSLTVTHDTARYQVITTRGAVAGRDFSCPPNHCASAEGRTVAPVSAPAALRGQARVTLGRLGPNVASLLLSRLYLSAVGTTLRLQGQEWTISNGGSQWAARFDGSELHRLGAASVAGVDSP